MSPAVDPEKPNIDQVEAVEETSGPSESEMASSQFGDEHKAHITLKTKMAIFVGRNQRPFIGLS